MWDLSPDTKELSYTQYTAVYDFNHWSLLQIYPRRTDSNTLNFLEEIVGRFPFSIQRIQIDRGLKFFALEVQAKLVDIELGLEL